MSLHPYLFFSGACRDAMTHYQSVLGGDLDVMTYGQLPASEEAPPFEVDADTVMHAALTFDNGEMLLASDDPTGDGAGVKGVALNWTLTDQDEARRIFDGLSDGGEIQMPLEATFWSPLFGSCVDRFGVSWMVNIDPDGEHGS